MFNEEQRHTARLMLKRLEGDRRRRCRAAGEQPARFPSGAASQGEETSSAVREELLILSKHQRRKRRQKDKPGEEQSDRKQKKRSSDDEQSVRGYLGEDGYLHHSDSEADWSDIGEDIYKSNRKRAGISKKEARRRRAWASDKDAATAAGRPWPAFPRSVVSEVLATVLEEVIAHDTAKGGVFSVPVPRDVFPEYYDQIKQPMDYGTMKEKLKRGEYRSAQAMQKDFVLVMSNCLQFNAPDSDIVKEARQQALMRPTVLKNAAMKHNLFLAEDGSVLEVYSDGEGEKDDVDRKEKKRKRRRRKTDSQDEPTESKKDVVSGAARLLRCKQCDGCRRSDCGECVACLDKPAFGGKGTLKQGCVQRQCTNMKEIAATNSVKKRSRKRGRSADNVDKSSNSRNCGSSSADDDSVRGEGKGSDDATISSHKKPRIRISLVGSSKSEHKITEDVNAAAKSKKGKKNKSKVTSVRKKEETSGDGDRSCSGRLSAVKRKSKRVDKVSEVQKKNSDGKSSSRAPSRSFPKRKKTTSVRDKTEAKIKGPAPPMLPERKDETLAAVHSTSGADAQSDRKRKENEEKDSPADLWLNIALLKKKRESLDGSFAAARANFTKHGPWQLPAAVDQSRFKDLAKQTLNIMCRHDHYSVFAEEVTEDEAPGYYDVVKQPMDYGTMRKKIDEGAYGAGSVGTAELYHDFLLVFDNCFMYNDEGGEVVEEASRLFGLAPEAFASACSAVTGKRKNPKKRKSSKT